ncbi:MAG: CRISPR-associated endonuclease Cas1 [Actinomycetota bacterium]
MTAINDGQQEPISISLVAHHAFCPRRAWLEASGETTDTRQMAVGTAAHAASDDPKASRARKLRAVEIASHRLGIIGRCDLVELDEIGRATLVEVKATPVRRRAEVTEPMVVQLALQAEGLRDAGFEVAGAAVYFSEHQVRVPVQVGPVEAALAEKHVRAVGDMLADPNAPEPLEDDPKCTHCSHAGVCLPDERKLTEVRRRVLVVDPDAQMLHLATPGSRASIRSGRVRVEKQGQLLGTVPIERVLAVVLHGNIDISSGLLRELLWRRVPVVWCSGTGRLVGWATSSRTPNGGSRVRQHVLSETGHLGLAREFVVAKVCNQATLLRRLGSRPKTVVSASVVEVVAALRSLQRRAATAGSVAELYGIEGDAAAKYFGVFSAMLSDRVRAQPGWFFDTRTRRPARDAINAALNFCYGMLLADVVRAVVTCGLDPHAGFLHSSGRNKPALALDLAEEFRAPVADSTVIGAFNNGELGLSGFSSVLGGVRMRDGARTALIAAYERRVCSQFIHPLFGYRVTWRRAMEIQARLVLGVIDGTQPAYKGIATR